MKKINISLIANNAIIAAIYVALTWVLSPISYGSIQFRISEVLVLLVCLNPKYSIGILIGTLIANTTSSLGLVDILFGTLATALAIIPMIFIKKIEISAIFPIITNSIIVGLELLYIYEIDFWYSFLTVGLGEAVVLYLIGIPVIHFISKNELLVSLMDLDISKIKLNNKITISQILTFIVFTIGIIFFFTYPVGKDIVSGNSNHITMFNLANNYWYIYLILASTICYLIFGLFNNDLKFVSILFITIIMTIYSLIPLVEINIDLFYYILFYLYIIIMVITILFKRKEV